MAVNVLVRSGALGDLIVTGPVIEAMRRKSGPLWVVAPARLQPLMPWADRWIDVESAEAARIYAGELPLPIEVGIAWTRRAADGLRGCGARIVHEGSPVPPPGTYIGEHLWSAAPAWLGSRTEPRVVVDPDVVRQIAGRLGSDRPVVISPGSGGDRKRWPIARWTEVAGLMDRPVIWVGGPVEADEPGWGTPRWDDLDLPGLAALASICHCWLAPDSGPAHLARAAGARVGVVFNGATDTASWAPPGATVFAGDQDPAELARWARSLG